MPKTKLKPIFLVFLSFVGQKPTPKGAFATKKAALKFAEALSKHYKGIDCRIIVWKMLPDSRIAMWLHSQF